MSDIFVKEGPGLLDAVACAPKGTPAEVVTAAVNRELLGEWEVVEATDDEENPFPWPCLDDPGKEHWVFSYVGMDRHLRAAVGP